jgi:hypothetical protein
VFRPNPVRGDVLSAASGNGDCRTDAPLECS